MTVKLPIAKGVALWLDGKRDEDPEILKLFEEKGKKAIADEKLIPIAYSPIIRYYDANQDLTYIVQTFLCEVPNAEQ